MNKSGLSSRGRCAAVLLISGGAFLFSGATAADDSGKLSMAEARKLKSPVPYTNESITQGSKAFARYACASCHGDDGKANVGAIADATDLTAPNLYKNGTSEGEIFRSIRDGAGEMMPPFKSQVSSEQDIWYLVNFIRSLWPASMQPPLQDGKK